MHCIGAAQEQRAGAAARLRPAAAGDDQRGRADTGSRAA